MREPRGYGSGVRNGGAGEAGRKPGRRPGHSRGGGTCRSVSPRGRCAQLQSADERRAVGLALCGAAAGVRGAGLPPRRGRGAHAAPAGDSAPREQPSPGTGTCC